MMILCENIDCQNHGPSGCKLPAIRIDADGGCINCTYPDNYWKQLEEEIRKMTEGKE